MTDHQVEKEARELGMVYRQEVLVFKGDTKAATTQSSWLQEDE